MKKLIIILALILAFTINCFSSDKYGPLYGHPFRHIVISYDSLTEKGSAVFSRMNSNTIDSVNENFYFMFSLLNEGKGRFENHINATLEKVKISWLYKKPDSILPLPYLIISNSEYYTGLPYYEILFDSGKKFIIIPTAYDGLNYYTTIFLLMESEDGKSRIANRFFCIAKPLVKY